MGKSEEANMEERLDAMRDGEQEDDGEIVPAWRMKTKKSQTKRCPECGQYKPAENFVIANAITKTNLPYKKAICSECYFGEDYEE